MHVDPVSDTAPAAARVQIGILRRASVERRLAGCFAWSQTMIALSRAGTRKRHPDATDAEVLLWWAAANYGRELANAVARRMGVPCPADNPSSS